MTSKLTHWARALGLLRPASARPVGAWLDVAALPSHDDAGPRVSPRLYDEKQRAAVWAKAQPILGWDPAEWRIDHRGNPLFRHHYGDQTSAFGWEVGRVAGRAFADADPLADLRPQLCGRAEAPGGAGVLNLDPFGR